ncbi:MAG: hypothetical protein AB7Q00_07240 [Phycisphaerales bacterium]
MSPMDFMLLTLSIYLAIGALLAIPLAFRGINSVDPAAANGSLPFRLLIIPGLIALWPLMLRAHLRRHSRESAQHHP